MYVRHKPHHQSEHFHKIILEKNVKKIKVNNEQEQGQKEKGGSRKTKLQG